MDTRNFPAFFAKSISLVFSPVILLPLLLYFRVTYSTLSLSQKQQSLFIFFIVGVIPIFLFFLYLRLSGKISDWDINKRSQRTVLNFSALLSVIGIYFLLRYYQISSLYSFTELFFTWFFFFTLITLRWKISAHTATVALFFLMMYSRIPFGFWLGLSSILLVAWARVYLKHHTVAQVLGGIILSGSIYVLFLIPTLFGS